MKSNKPKYLISLNRVEGFNDYNKTYTIVNVNTNTYSSISKEASIELNDDLIDFLLCFWERWTESPEYPLYQKLKKIREESSTPKVNLNDEQVEEIVRELREGFDRYILLKTEE